MDSASRKRKLSDYGKNITPSRRSFRDETILSREENELNVCNQRLGLNEETDAQSFAKEGLQGNLHKKLAIIVELTETDKKVQVVDESCSRELTIFNDNEEIVETDEIEEEEDGKGEEENDAEEDENGVDDETNEKIVQSTRLAADIGDKPEIMWFSTEYIEDIISYEMYKESSYHLSENFCRKFDINPTGREILIDWLISVQVHLKAENSALHLAIALLDTMLDSIHIPLSELQAAAVSSFWVAFKYIHGSLGMKSLLSLCAGSVTKDMIETYEILVLQTSRLIQAGGSLTVFFNYVLYKIFGFKFPPEIYYCGLYFIEIMLLQFIFVDCPSYEKALTAVFTALSVFGCPDPFDFVDMSKFITKRKLHHVYRRLMRSLRLMYNDKDTLKNSNVYRKYKSSRYYKISMHNNLKCLASA